MLPIYVHLNHIHDPIPKLVLPLNEAKLLIKHCSSLHRSKLIFYIIISRALNLIFFQTECKVNTMELFMAYSTMSSKIYVMFWLIWCIGQVQCNVHTKRKLIYIIKWKQKMTTNNWTGWPVTAKKLVNNVVPFTNSQYLIFLHLKIQTIHNIKHKL